MILEPLFLNLDFGKQQFGTLNLDFGTLNLDVVTSILELRFWNFDFGTCICHFINICYYCYIVDFQLLNITFVTSNLELRFWNFDFGTCI